MSTSREDQFRRDVRHLIEQTRQKMLAHQYYCDVWSRTERSVARVQRITEVSHSCGSNNTSGSSGQLDQRDVSPSDPAPPPALRPVPSLNLPVFQPTVSTALAEAAADHGTSTVLGVSTAEASDAMSTTNAAVAAPVVTNENASSLRKTVSFHGAAQSASQLPSLPEDGAVNYLSIHTDDDRADVSTVKKRPASAGSLASPQSVPFPHRRGSGPTSTATDQTLGRQLFERPMSAGAVRRRLGLPEAVSEALNRQIGQDADRTYRRLFDAFCRRLDPMLTSPITVQRITNESTRSIHAQLVQDVTHQLLTAQGHEQSHSWKEFVDVPDIERSNTDFHWFASRNVVFEIIAGISSDSYGLMECATERMTETQRLQLRAFAGQARRGFPVGGFRPSIRHAAAITFEPQLPSEFDTVNDRQAFRVKCRLKALLVGSVHQRGTEEQSKLGHNSNPIGKQLLGLRTAATYNARVAAEQQLRKEARMRREMAAGLNPHFMRTKPSCAAPYGNSIMQHSCDNVHDTASLWLDDEDKNGTVRAAPTTANELLGIAPGPRRKTPFPEALRALLAAKQSADAAPLRSQKEYTGACSLENFVRHDELSFEPHFLAVYEEPEETLDRAEVFADEDPATEKRRTAGAPKRYAKKVVDFSKVMLSLKELRKRTATGFSLMEYTTRWGVPIDSVFKLISADPWIRRWVYFPDDLQGTTTPLKEVLEACGRGSVSIDVANSKSHVQYRHSFTFASSSSATHSRDV